MQSCMAALIIVKHNSWCADPVSSACIRFSTMQHQTYITVVLMAITLSLVALHEWVQQYRALMMVLQSLKTQTMISGMPSLSHIACASKAYQILSPLLFEQSLYLSLLICSIYLSLSFFTCLAVYLILFLTIIPSTTAELCSTKKGL